MSCELGVRALRDQRALRVSVAGMMNNGNEAAAWSSEIPRREGYEWLD